MNQPLGFFAALVSILVWGTYLVPMKRVKNYDLFLAQLIMGVSIFSFSTLVSLLTNRLIVLPLGIVTGSLWVVGNILSVIAIEKSGLSKAVPTWMGIIIFITFIAGAFFFNEPFQSLLLATVGIIALVLGIILVAGTSAQNQATNRRGIFLAVVAAIVYSLSGILYKVSQSQPLDFIFSVSLGVLITAVVIYLIRLSPWQRNLLFPAAFAGVTWNIGSIAAFFAVDNLGVALGFPLTQLAFFVSILWGLFYFKEVKGRKNISQLIIGAIILFSGALLLSFSK